jgi:ParB-like chromosome segregation protein Spo0J
METIDLDKLDKGDQRYCISYPLQDELLLSAVARFGLLSPIGLLSSSRPIIVAGFKRVQAARRLGITRIPCVFLNLGEKEALLMAINDNIARPLNTIEKAHAIAKMRRMEFSDTDTEAIIKLVGLPRKETTVEHALAIAEMDEGSKDFVVRHSISFLTVEQLLWFYEDDRRAIMVLMDGVRPTASFLREILQLLMLMKAKKGGIDFDKLRGAADAADLKHRVKLLTHPRLSEMEEELLNILHSCALPPEIRIAVDPAFEKDRIDISFKVRKPDDVAKAVEKLESIEHAGHLRRLLDLTQGSPDRNGG